VTVSSGLLIDIPFGLIESWRKGLLPQGKRTLNMPRVISFSLEEAENNLFFFYEKNLFAPRRWVSFS
jgi:hypothetical protein